jgi:transposase
VPTATHPDAQTFDRVRSVPGGGPLLALVLLSAMHDIQRFPRVQAFVSSGRRVKGAQASAGKRYGTSGKTMGNASLTGAFSEAAGRCLRTTAAGPKSLVRLEQTHGPGQARPMLAHKLARAVSDMLTRAVAFARATGRHGERRGGREPGGSLDDEGLRLAPALCPRSRLRLGTRKSA